MLAHVFSIRKIRQSASAGGADKPVPLKAHGAQNLQSPTSRHLLRNAAYLLLVGLVSAFVLGTVIFEQTKKAIGAPPLEAVAELSKTVVDRNGKLLRAYTTKDGYWRLPLSHTNVDETYLKLLFAFEDRRYWQHGGIDIFAIIRATKQLATNGRVVSGASTLTMQVARLVDRKHERTAGGKLRQMARAIQLESKLSKVEILNLYLRLAPFGGNIEGVRAASLAYFGKEPGRLSVAQAALLVALPQSPERRRPDRNPKNAKSARAHVLQQGVLRGVITQAEANRALREPIPTRRFQFPKFSAHLSDVVILKDKKSTRHELTIDRKLQGSLERLTKQHAHRLGNKISAAIVVVDHTTGEVVASVGSPDYLDASRLGAIDMTQAIRSPGSTLKPLIYGLGFDAGFIHPETLIEDRPTRFGHYAPKNFDKGYSGTITIRHALAQSLNIPAVKVLNVLGPTALVAKIRDVTTKAQLPAGTNPTLAVGLGGIGLRLMDLAKIYTVIARQGVTTPLFYKKQDLASYYRTGAVAKAKDSKPLLSDVASAYITNILKEAPPPENAKPGQIAYKTGTSYGYRDALAVGYDGKHVIAVWVGRADGSSIPGLLGRTAAAPILFDAFHHISPNRTPFASPPAAALNVAGHDLPPPLKRFQRDRIHATKGGPFLETPVAIAFPPDRTELSHETTADGPQTMVLRAEGGQLPLTWLIDGEPIHSQPHNRHVIWQPKDPGFVKLTVIDSVGQVDRVTVRLK